MQAVEIYVTPDFGHEVWEGIGVSVMECPDDAVECFLIKLLTIVQQIIELIGKPLHGAQNEGVPFVAIRSF